MSKPSKPEVADCRKCRWRGEVTKGVSVGCRFGDAAEDPAPIPWRDVLNPCRDFKAPPVRRKAKGGKQR